MGRVPACNKGTRPPGLSAQTPVGLTPAPEMRFLLSVGGDSAGDIPGGRPGMPAPNMPLPPASSHAPYRGDIARGGAGEGTPSPAKRTILALP